MRIVLILILLLFFNCSNKEKSSINDSLEIDLPINEVLNDNSRENNATLYYKVKIKGSFSSSYYLMDSVSGKIVKEIPNYNRTNLYQYSVLDSEGYISNDKSFIIFRSCNPKTCCFKYTCSMYSLYLYDIKKDIKTQISPDNFSCETFQLLDNNQILYEGYFGEIKLYEPGSEAVDFVSNYDSLKKLKYQLK